MRKIILITLFSITSILTNTFALADDAKSPMVYRYWVQGTDPKRDEYQFALLQLVLEKTIATYGKYELTKVEENYNDLRATREIGRGEIINIEASSHQPLTQKASEKIHDKKIRIKIPILHGLLGYRKLVVRRADLEKFEHITDEDELKKLYAGQGKGWKDIDIYKYNGYNVVGPSDYLNLFSMLAAKRFDYLPLSVLEVDRAMKQFSKQSDEFAVVQNLCIYYPLPVLFDVSKSYPELADRITRGLEMVKADGSLSQLFENHFHEELAKIRDEKKTIFILKNPNIPDSMGLKNPPILNSRERHEAH